MKLHSTESSATFVFRLNDEDFLLYPWKPLRMPILLCLSGTSIFALCFKLELFDDKCSTNPCTKRKRKQLPYL